MGWLTGRDTGTKARNKARGRVRKCGRCNRPLKSNGQCPVCSVDIAAHSSGRNAVVVSSHRCSDGKTRTTRTQNGRTICGGPC